MTLLIGSITFLFNNVAIKAVEEKFRKEYFSEISGVEELVTQELWDSWVHRS